MAKYGILKKLKLKNEFPPSKKFSYFSLIWKSSDDCPQIREEKKVFLRPKKVSVTTKKSYRSYANFFM